MSSKFNHQLHVPRHLLSSMLCMSSSLVMWFSLKDSHHARLNTWTKQIVENTCFITATTCGHTASVFNMCTRCGIIGLVVIRYIRCWSRALIT
jgi:hypothetical protein